MAVSSSSSGPSSSRRTAGADGNLWSNPQIYTESVSSRMTQNVSTDTESSDPRDIQIASKKSFGPIGSQIYPFGLPNDIASCSEEIRSATAKLLLQRLQHSGSRGGYGTPGTPGSRRGTGGSSDYNSLASTPSGSLGSLFSSSKLNASRFPKVHDRASLTLKDVGDLVLKSLHSNDYSGMEKLLSVYCRHFPIVTQSSGGPAQPTPPNDNDRADSIGSAGTLKDFATRASRRKSAVSFSANPDAISLGTQGSMLSYPHHTPASSQVSTVSRTPCIFQNTLHMAIVHQQYAMVELLLRSGLDPNSRAVCTCMHSANTSRKPSSCPLGPGEASSGMSLRAARTMFCNSCTCQSMVNFNIVDLTPLEVAVKTKNVDVITAVCRAGAQVNSPNFLTGNSPLLEVVKDSPLSWPVVETLLLFGAKIHQKNLQNVCPVDLAPELTKFQTFCVDELTKIACASGGTQANFAAKFSAEAEHSSVSRVPSRNPVTTGSLSRASSTHMQSPRPSTIHTPSFKASHGLTTIQQSFDSPSGTSNSGSSPVEKVAPWINNSTTSRTAAEPSVYSHSVDGTSLKAYDGSSMKASTGNLHCLQRRRSQISFHKKFTKGKDDSSHSMSMDQAWSSLVDMSSNSETIMAIQISLLKQVSALARIDQEANIRFAVDSRMGQVLHTILLTCLEEYDENPYSENERKDSLVKHLCPMIKFCVQLLQKGGNWIQFTVISTLNKIVDLSLVLQLFNVDKLHFLSDSVLGRSRSMDDLDLNRYFTSDSQKDIQSTDTEPPELFDKEKHSDSATDLLQAFKQIGPETIITVLHNMLTLEKRVIGVKPVCSPSHRWRQCSYHCTEILTGRLLLFLCHLSSFRNALADPQHTKVLVQTLDATLDPQLLCLLLQSVALMALETKTHAMLEDLQIDDLLIQMLLPADDWYYTNHSTKFGQFVKHHAARILIYIGLGDRVGSRVNLFQFPGIGPEEISLSMALYPTEDDYICKTCSTPVMGQTLLGAKAFSVEGILAKILTELCLVAKRRKSKEQSDRKRSSEATLTGDNITFHNLEPYLMRLSCMVEPVVLLRVILHKLSWDLGLVRKKQSVARKMSDAKMNTLMPGPFKKSKSFDKKPEKKPIEPTDSGKDADPVKSVASRSSAGTTRLAGRRISSLELLPVTSKEKERVKEDARKRIDSTGSRGTPHIHLPKYIQNLFRNRTATIALPLRPKSRERKLAASNESGSDSDAVLEFQKRLQNYPVSRRSAVSKDRKRRDVSFDLPERSQSNQEHYTRPRDSLESGHSVSFGTSSPLGSPYTPHFSFDLSSPPVNGDVTQPVSAADREAAPQLQLPSIEIRRPSVYSEYSYGYRLESPESDCLLPLLTPPADQADRRSSATSSRSSGCDSRRPSSELSVYSLPMTDPRGSVEYTRFSGPSPVLSLASDNSGPFLFSFIMRRRASTIGTTLNIKRRLLNQLSHGSGASEDTLGSAGMSPEFQLLRHIIVTLLTCYPKDANDVISGFKETADILKQILNSPQEPTVKGWCADIVEVVTAQVEEVQEESKQEQDERLNEDYLDFQEQISSGQLPLSREEAALLAAIQLCVEENWPINKRRHTIQRQILRGNFGRVKELAQKIMITPWEVDHNLYCTPPRKQAALAIERPRGSDVSISSSVPALPVESEKSTPDTPHSSKVGSGSPKPFILARCIQPVEESVLDPELQAQCLPPELRGDRRTMKLIKVREILGSSTNLGISTNNLISVMLIKPCSPKQADTKNHTSNHS